MNIYNKQRTLSLISENEKENIIEEYLNDISAIKLSKKYNIKESAIRLLFIYKKIKKTNNNWRQKNRKYIFDQNIFEECNTSEKAYWIGYLMADGTITKSGIKISSSDVEIHDKFLNFIGNSNIPRSKSHNSNTCYNTNICSKKIIKDCEKYGLINNKTFRTCIKNISSKYLSHFIRGYFDGDGHIYVRKNNRYANCGITSSSTKIIEQIVKILYDNNIIKSKIKNYVYNRKYKISCFTISIDNRLEIQKFYKFIYNNATIFLQRKWQEFQKIINLPQRIKERNASSKYRGVFFNKSKNKYTSYLTLNSKTIIVDHFINEKEAAIAYNDKILELNLPREMLNKIEE